jgi:hypothetical protein
MGTDFEKLAEAFGAGASFLEEDEKLVLAAAVETVLEESSGVETDPVATVLLASAVADAILSRR